MAILSTEDRVEEDEKNRHETGKSQEEILDGEQKRDVLCMWIVGRERGRHRFESVGRGSSRHMFEHVVIERR